MFKKVIVGHDGRAGADDEHADLLVLGSAHNGALGRMLLGDVSRAALHGSPCPVVVTLPLIVGPAIDALPYDERGFLPTDDQGHVVGLSDVFAAGDGTTFPVKQGGLACQQADAIAELLAAAAGASVTPQPFRPVLRGRVLDGRGAQYLEHALHGGAGDGPDLSSSSGRSPTRSKAATSHRGSRSWRSGPLRRPGRRARRHRGRGAITN